MVSDEDSNNKHEQSKSDSEMVSINDSIIIDTHGSQSYE